MNSPPSHAMEQFFGAYFHQDWVVEAEDWPDIVDTFLVGKEPDRLNKLATEIDDFRGQRSEADLHAAMINMGGFYDPRPDMTYGEWLGQVASRLRQDTTALDERRGRVEKA
ncbi:contact-dependent growth inhibition system immunity protein [Mycolicibacterium sp. F2034L]|uniref:contact-dependent growth inhibition system immunity protein n=1 Tax=Mycolicibacterium sp. F2034L TaxID=2926422 RepID=UPI001FF16759|nr:contact-dependent growth inhibition system immunity protein [Mycolicibacterium sp. F2034L]MCK0177614.1 contact-dependent growth inhibition system immunity protein [Mycolicibacterium sp. F2034L]